jgi:protein-disulfide isomerase
VTPVDEEDLTRKQRREQARAERKAAEAAAAADAGRRRRMTQLGGVAVVVIAAIVVILIATGGGGKSASTVPTKTEIPKIAQEVNAELAGLPQSGRTIGNASAPATMQYFGDLQCPICKTFSAKSGALPKLLQGQVKEGKLRIEYLSLQTATRDPETFHTQQKAALAAGKQNKAWNYIELFYEEQGEEGTEYVTESFLQGIAQQIPGLNLANWSTDRNDPKFEAELATDAQLANNNGLTGTPSFLIGHSGGALKKYEWSSLTDPKGFEQAVDKAAKE